MGEHLYVMDAICDDLAAEHEALDALVREQPDAAWDRPTPAEGWSVRDQISHLWFFDERAALAATDGEAFAADLAALVEAGGTDASVVPGRALAPAALLASWRDGRARLLAVLRPLDPKARIPWYGPAMGALSFATARLMETWAHGEDVADALGVTRDPTDRLRHVCHIGVRARAFSYAVHGREVPAGDVRVELTGPSGDGWSWGDSDRDVVRGPALDFARVVTQRRHRADTALEVSGPLAEDWIAIAQAFAGAAGAGRRPGQFPR
jgi:uncharacterized protein (TIGR03084 family)